MVAELLSQNSDHEDYIISISNRFSLFAGLIGGFGMFIVANFQETAVVRVHLTGKFTVSTIRCPPIHRLKKDMALEKRKLRD